VAASHQDLSADSCLAVDLQQFIQLGMNGLSVAVLSGWMNSVMSKVAMVTTPCQAKLPGSNTSQSTA
jgi:hypothetical protein